MINLAGSAPSYTTVPRTQHNKVTFSTYTRKVIQVISIATQQYKIECHINNSRANVVVFIIVVKQCHKAVF